MFAESYINIYLATASSTVSQQQSDDAFSIALLWALGSKCNPETIYFTVRNADNSQQSSASSKTEFRDD